MSAADWTEQFDGTRQLPREVRDQLLRAARPGQVPAGAQVFGPGQVPDTLLFLTKGTLRVMQRSDAGREIVLYRVEAGQSCVLTTACILMEEAYGAEGIAETQVDFVRLPRADFDRLVSAAPAFRDFVFSAYSKRLVDLLRVVDDVAFGQIDKRLADRLLSLGQERRELVITHQALATELGTAREVISRQLSEFQRRDWIAQTRGRIELIDKSALRALAQHA